MENMNYMTNRELEAILKGAEQYIAEHSCESGIYIENAIYRAASIRSELARRTRAKEKASAATETNSKTTI